MRMQPRTFGDGGGVSRRDHAVRTANSFAPSSIDKVLADNSRAGIGKVDHVGNLFRTMDTGAKGDPYSPENEPDYEQSFGEADEGLAQSADRTSITNRPAFHEGHQNNLAAAVYQQSVTGLPVPVNDQASVTVRHDERWNGAAPARDLYTVQHYNRETGLAWGNPKKVSAKVDQGWRPPQGNLES